MKIFKFLLLFTLMSGIASAQSEFMGKYVYQDEFGAINIVADAGVVMNNLDSPYLMFVLFMWADPNISATVNRKDVLESFNQLVPEQVGRILFN